jgi:hypothetical protein
METLIQHMPSISRSTEASEWLYESLFYILIVANAICIFIGLIMFIRPSTLKTLEKYSNTWVSNEKLVKRLDSRKDIPEHVLPGNMRLFGIAVLLGGLYMVLAMLKLH